MSGFIPSMETTSDELRDNTIVIGGLSLSILDPGPFPDVCENSLWCLWRSCQEEGALSHFSKRARDGG